MSGFVYKQTEPALWTVGHYAPDGTWEPESDHRTASMAAGRAAALNGQGVESPGQIPVAFTDLRAAAQFINGEIDAHANRVNGRVEIWLDSPASSHAVANLQLTPAAASWLAARLARAARRLS